MSLENEQIVGVFVKLSEKFQEIDKEMNRTFFAIKHLEFCVYDLVQRIEDLERKIPVE